MLSPRDRDRAILADILVERQRQDDKFGANRDQSFSDWWLILSEEYGEASHDMTDGHFSSDWEEQRAYFRHLCIELKETAAVCVAFIDALNRYLDEGNDNVH